VNEDEDLELQALQRQLDDAFQTTRPRPAFEDELWLRMQARRPIWTRFREGVAGLLGGLREAPAIPSAAVAIALIVVIGAGVISLGGGLNRGAGSSTTAALDSGGKNGSAAPPPFGALPVPAMAANPSVPGSYGPQGTREALYASPAVLTWAGVLTVNSSSLPVFRYAEPTTSDANRFAVSVGAAPSAHVAPGGLGMYTGKGFTLVVDGTVAQPAREPSYEWSELKSLPGASTGDPVAVASAFLAAHGLTPTWPYQTDVQRSSTIVQVRFFRSLDLQGQGQAPLVNGAGDKYGIEVDIPTSSPGAFATGPLPLNLDSVSYPIISADQAVRSALASSAPSSAGAAYPTVKLTSAELVYTLVWAGDRSFYEPAFLFSGTFTYQGTNYVKRVLVPAVAPRLLSP
jgi:hypothetical protein